MNEHLSKQFDAELDSVRARVTYMGGLVEEQFRRSIAAFANDDLDLIAEVLAREKDVDALEVAIDDDCVHIIARRQPTAVDLRMVMAMTKTVVNLERIGDEAKKIAKMARRLHEATPLQMPRFPEIINVAEQAADMLHEVLDAFVRMDAVTSARIVREDKAIDEHFRSILRLLATYMMEDPRTITAAMDIVFLAKAIERIGDHTKNIAEHVIFMAKGTDVRHIGLEQLEKHVLEADQGN